MLKHILLYYKYVVVDDPIALQTAQRELCTNLELRGRIVVATEGINGTLCGSQEATQRYIDAMHQDPRFADVDFKIDVVDGQYQYFKNLRVVIRDEIVHLGIAPEALPFTQTAKHLTPVQVHELLTQKPDDLVVLDGRNNYEARIGRFVGQISPDVEHFRDFPAYIDKNLELFKDKTVLMHCTGGIRCERASAYLQAKGIAKEVLQIEGGIRRYVEQFPDGFFRGKNYVFDDRVSVPVNNDIMATCDHCSTACDQYNNCANASCNKQFIGCNACLDAYTKCCSKNCHEKLSAALVQKRPDRPALPIHCTTELLKK